MWTRGPAGQSRDHKTLKTLSATAQFAHVRCYACKARLSQMQLQKTQNSSLPKNSLICCGAAHRYRSRKFFAGAKDFCPNSNQLARKKPIRYDLLKNSSSCYFGHRWAPFLLIFSGIFTKSKLLGLRLHSRLLHQWCCIKSECYMTGLG